MESKGLGQVPLAGRLCHVLLAAAAAAAVLTGAGGLAAVVCHGPAA